MVKVFIFGKMVIVMKVHGKMASKMDKEQINLQMEIFILGLTLMVFLMDKMGSINGDPVHFLKVNSLEE